MCNYIRPVKCAPRLYEKQKSLYVLTTALAAHREFSIGHSLPSNRGNISTIKGRLFWLLKLIFEIKYKR